MLLLIQLLIQLSLFKVFICALSHVFTQLLVIIIIGHPCQTICVTAATGRGVIDSNQSQLDTKELKQRSRVQVGLNRINPMAGKERFRAYDEDWDFDR